MASEEHDDAVSFALPADVREWIGDEADRHDENRETIYQRLLAAVHAAATDDAIDPVGRGELEEVRGQVDAQREEFVDLLEDVRKRVIQVKREADRKAPADHDHEGYATGDDLDALRGEVEGVADDLDRLSTDLATVEETVDAGFENFEEVLEYLVDERDDLRDRSTTLARAVLDLREQRDALAARERVRAETDALKLAANRLGIRKATCESCGSSVDISLLIRPECPQCASSFADVEKKSSIFGSHRLLTGEPPALDGRVSEAVDREDGELFEAVAADAESDDDGREGVR